MFYNKGLNQEVVFPDETRLLGTIANVSPKKKKKNLETFSLLGKHKLQIESRMCVPQSLLYDSVVG